VFENEVRAILDLDESTASTKEHYNALFAPWAVPSMKGNFQ
jgi:hypothetical protein